MATRRAVLLLGLAVLGLMGLGSAHASHVPAAEIQWACGFGGSGARGHPDRCGINPVGGGPAVQSEGEPRFSTTAWVGPQEQVLGVVIQGDARAYPLKMMSAHEIVNDEIGGVPVVVTYCPLCGSGVTFERVVAVDGAVRELTFTASGFLFQHDLVMWDPQTETLWNQIGGLPIGTLRDERVESAHPDAELRLVSTAIATWDAWTSEHPQSVMIQPVRSSYRDPYSGYYANCNIGISGGRTCDIDGLHPKAVVAGVVLPDGRPVAYPVEAVDLEGGLIVHQAPGRTVVVAADASGLTRLFDGGARQFARDAAGTWRDEDGDAWDLARGERTDGAARLGALEHRILFWFAWKDHFPDTLLWEPEAGLDGVGPGGEAPGAAASMVLAALALSVLAAPRRRSAAP